MGRRAVWPPKMTRHHTGRARVCWRGKDYWPGQYGTPEARAAYKVLLERLAADEARPKPPPGRHGPTVAEVVAKWNGERKPKLADVAADRYGRSLTVLVRTCGHLLAAEFDSGQLERVREAMLDGSWIEPGEAGRHGLAGANRRGRGKWSPRHAQRMASRIKTVWRWLERQKLVPKGSWAELRTLGPLACPPPRRRDWTEEEVQRVAAAVRRGPVRLMLLVQLWSGCRPSEVRGMLWEEIDRGGPLWLWRPARHKNAWRGHERVIVLGPQAQAVLALARKRSPRSALVFPCAGRSGARRSKGREYTASVYARTTREAAKRAGLPPMTPYDVRHCARMRISRLLGLEAARSVLGHSSISQTAEYGQGVDLKLAEEAARRAG